MKRLFCKVALAFLCSFSIGVLSARPIYFGVEEFALENQRDNVIEALKKALGPVFSGQDVNVREYSVEELAQAVVKGEVDISAGL